jgi:hypothetical protein
MYSLPITVAARPKARIVLAGSDAGVVRSNPTRGMDICMQGLSVKPWSATNVQDVFIYTLYRNMFQPI